jgi:hypothetical protein
MGPPAVHRPLSASVPAFYNVARALPEGTGLLAHGMLR